MGYCKATGFDCAHTDRDNSNRCALDECKFELEIDENGVPIGYPNYNDIDLSEYDSVYDALVEASLRRKEKTE